MRTLLFCSIQYSSILTHLPSFVLQGPRIQWLHHKIVFTSSKKLAYPVETVRGPYVDPYYLNYLAFFYLDLPAKFHFSQTMHSAAASQDALLHPPGSWHTL
jgi:hypothetical protein